MEGSGVIIPLVTPRLMDAITKCSVRGVNVEAPAFVWWLFGHTLASAAEQGE